MVRVDLIVESDEMPRVRLLQDHMRNLDVDLILHEEEPDQPAPRRLIVPKEFGSAFTELHRTPGVEYIALHLDERSQDIHADFSVRIPSWPGRSSDHDVRQLANYLRQPVEKPAARPTGKHKPLYHNSTAMLAGFALLSAAAIGVGLMDADNPASIEQRLPQALQKEHTRDAAHDFQPDDGAIASAESDAPNTTRCADPLDVLQATLNWQAPTDFAPCEKKPERGASPAW